MSQLQVNRINDASGGVLAPISSVMRNRIINGAMVIDQRNAGAAVTAGSAYTLDRWNVDRTWSGATVTIQQSSAAPAGFSNSMLATVSTGAASASGSYFSIQQYIEGNNIAGLAFGTASAQQFTVSFWVRSSITGTFGVCFRNSAFDLSYCTTYTISAANTWEQKSVTIAAPTTGTWGTGNSYGLNVIFSLGGGSTFKPSSNNAWLAGNFIVAAGQTDLIATTGATFNITGIQLEVGTQATSFEYRQYTTELQLCQRYLPAWGGTSGNQDFCSAFNQTTTSTNFSLAHQVTTRVPPTGVVASGSLFFIGSNNAYAVSSVAFVGSSTQVTRLSGTISGGVANAGGNGFGQGTWLVYLTGCEL